MIWAGLVYRAHQREQTKTKLLSFCLQINPVLCFGCYKREKSPRGNVLGMPDMGIPSAFHCKIPKENTHTSLAATLRAQSMDEADEVIFLAYITEPKEIFQITNMSSLLRLVYFNSTYDEGVAYLRGRQSVQYLAQQLNNPLYLRVLKITLGLSRKRDHF